MRGVNKVILVGNAGKDPEVRYLPSGGAVATVALATSESWNDKNTGQRQEVTEWHKLVFYGKLAEIVGEFVQKGSKLYCEGSIHTRSWDDQQSGEKKYRTEIKCMTMQMLDSRKDQQGGGQDQDYGGGYDEPPQNRGGAGGGQQRQPQGGGGGRPAPTGGGGGSRPQPQGGGQQQRPQPRPANQTGPRPSAPLPDEFDDQEIPF